MIRELKEILRKIKDEYNLPSGVEVRLKYSLKEPKVARGVILKRNLCGWDVVGEVVIREDGSFELKSQKALYLKRLNEVPGLLRSEAVKFVVKVYNGHGAGRRKLDDAFVVSSRRRFYVITLVDSLTNRVEHVGIIAGMFKGRKKGLVSHLVILPEYRRKGYAERAVEMLVSMMEAEGIRRAWCVVRKDNEPAMRLFEKLGFRAVAEKEEDGIVIVRMEKSLA